MTSRSKKPQRSATRVNSAAMAGGAAVVHMPGRVSPTQRQAPTTYVSMLPRIRIGSGALEALKWIALLAMTVDHINKYLFDWAHPWMFAIGRLAFPLFTLVLAYKLSQVAAADRAGVAGRVATRLLVVGLVATVPFIAAGHIQFSWWWPLNVLFTLAGGAGVVWAMERRSWFVAACVFIGIGAVAEFYWPGLLLFVAAFRYFKRPSPLSLLGIVLGASMLSAINGNHWALMGLALFVAAAAAPKSLQVPRLKRLFYVYYPAHLAALAGLQLILATPR